MIINYGAVVIAAVVAMAIGAFWYSKSLFGMTWASLMQFSPEQMTATKCKGMTQRYVAHFIGLLVTSYVLARFSVLFGVSSATDAIALAFLSWLGFVAATAIAVVLWEGKPFKLYLINVSQALVAFIAIALIVGLWH